MSRRYKSFGLRLEITARARIASPASVTTPTALPFSTITSRTGASTRMSAPLRGGGLRHRLRDRAHAADRMTPRALLAVHLAEAVMQQHIGRARRVGARVVPDDAVQAVDRLDRIALEPGVEIVAGRVGEEVEQLALQIEAEVAQPVGDAAGLDQLGDRRERMALDDVRRRLAAPARAARRPRLRAAPDRRRAAPRRARKTSPLPGASCRRRSSGSARHRAAGNSRFAARRCAGHARRAAGRRSPSD